MDGQTDSTRAQLCPLLCRVKNEKFPLCSRGTENHGGTINTINHGTRQVHVPTTCTTSTQARQLCTAGERLRLSVVETGTRHVISTGETKKKESRKRRTESF